MKKGLKAESNGSASADSKLLGRKDKKHKQADVSDIGVMNMEQVLAQAVGADKSVEDSFERYYNKDLDLDEDQVPVVIYELNESAINFISQESYEKALILLQKAQTMLEQIQADQNPKDSFVFLLTLHNMAMCYQKLGILEDCAICLEACLANINSPYLQEYFNDPLIPSLRLKMLKYKCKTHMQICALLSQVHKHKEAVIHAKEGIKIAHFLVKDLEQMSLFYTQELLQRKPLEEISIINNFKFSLLEKTSVKILPVLRALRKKMAFEEDDPNSKKEQSASRTSIAKDDQVLGGAFDQADMKNLLGYLNQSEWIYSLNIGNIMQIAPLTMQDFMSVASIELELSREYVLEKLCFLAVSYFCMGTEFRFLHQLQEMLGEHIYTRRDSEYWHGKAVEVAISFLPSESPLVSHILMSYEKHHSPSNQVIPEDEHQEVQVRVVRQIRGVDSNKLQPIIRHHNDKDFRISSTADIQPMDYRSIVYKIPLTKQQRLPRHHPQSNLNKVDNTGDYSLEINESGDLDVLIDDDDGGNAGGSSAFFKKGGSSGTNNQAMFQRKRVSKSTNENNNSKARASKESGGAPPSATRVASSKQRQSKAGNQSTFKNNHNRSIEDIEGDDDDEGEDQLDTNGGLNDRADDLDPINNNGHPKYYSVIDDHNQSITPMGGNRADMSANQILMMNMASIDSNSEFANASVSASASNTLNNKKNRKLKRVGQNGQQTQPSDTNVAFIDDGQFVQSQSFYNEANTANSQAETSITGQPGGDERRAKSSMGNGDSSAGRLRNKIAGVQKQLQNSQNSSQQQQQSQQAQLMLIQQIRGNSSSAMARLHPQQQLAQHNSQTTPQQVMKTSSGGMLQQIDHSNHLQGGISGPNSKMTRSQFESITHNTNMDDVLIEDASAASMFKAPSHPGHKGGQSLLGAGGNPQRRFKNNQQHQQPFNMPVNNILNDLNQSIESHPSKQQQLRNDQARQNNSSSRDKSAPTRAPITDIRKKQSSTINVDDLPQSSVVGKGNLLGNSHQSAKNAQSQMAGGGTNTNSALDTLNLSMERESVMQSRLNQSALGTVNSLNTSILNTGGAGVSGNGQSKRVTQKQQQQQLQQSLQQQQIFGRTPGVRAQTSGGPQTIQDPSTGQKIQKFFNSHQPPQQNQLLGMMAGISNSQQSTEGLLQMMKKREKLNNSAMSTSKPISTPIIPPPPQQMPQQDTQQFMQQLSKLYSSKRTPTAGSNPPNHNANNGGGSRDNSQTNPTKKTGQASSGQKDAKTGMKFTGFTQDNWNTGAADFQKLLQLENIKKGMARKSSKENNTSAGPIIVSSHGASNKNNFINNLVFPQNAAVDSDGSEGNLISATGNNAGGAATRHKQQQIIQQQQQLQYENWLQFQNTNQSATTKNKPQAQTPNNLIMFDNKNGGGGGSAQTTVPRKNTITVPSSVQ